MRRFILRIIPFVIPFILCYLCYLYYGARDQGDLLRIGNLAHSDKDYRNVFNQYTSVDTAYTDLSKATKRAYTALTIGDSFSQNGNIGYQNFLSNKEGVSVVHFNQKCNSIEMLNSIINGDLLDSMSLEYIIIQSVERSFVTRATNFDSTEIVNFHQAMKMDEKAKAHQREQKILREKTPLFFSNSTIKFPLFNLLHLIDDNAFLSNVYRVKTEKNLFSTENNELLFYEDDLLSLEINNNPDKIEAANQELNFISSKLSKKGVKLIVAISPDKFGIYYDYIKQNTNYPKPLFFDYWNTLPKKYLYINTKEILANSIKSIDNVYYYDDTHWSPIASEILANKISEIISK